MTRHRPAPAAPTAAPGPAPSQPATPDAAFVPQTVWPPRRWSPVGCAPEACCCAAAPVVQVVLPPAAGRAPAELLLCGHHFRASKEALTARDALFFDVLGDPLRVEGDPVFAPTADQLFD
jgi:hypothetical protein